MDINTSSTRYSKYAYNICHIYPVRAIDIEDVPQYTKDNIVQCEPADDDMPLIRVHRPLQRPRLHHATVATLTRPRSRCRLRLRSLGPSLRFSWQSSIHYRIRHPNAGWQWFLRRVGHACSAIRPGAQEGSGSERYDPRACQGFVVPRSGHYGTGS